MKFSKHGNSPFWKNKKGTPCPCGEVSPVGLLSSELQSLWNLAFVNEAFDRQECFNHLVLFSADCFSVFLAKRGPQSEFFRNVWAAA
ncbi:hypothetical protein [Sphingobium sp.]|uniref:hypothetical protein n=1 Tax=Sphingobium sp. TaxID=1912891 RepID=UPI003BB67567